MKKRISASEINEFNYCPYSWLNSRYYGKGHISKGVAKRLDQGTKYHDKKTSSERKLSTHNNKTKVIAVGITLAIIIGSILFLLY